MIRWKELERTTARKLGGKRFPRWLNFSQSAPDVVIDDFPQLIVDAKSRKRFAFHTLMAEIETKYCERPGDVPILVTKSHGQVGEYVTMPLDYFAELLSIARESHQISTERRDRVSWSMEGACKTQNGPTTAHSAGRCKANGYTKSW